MSAASASRTAGPRAAWILAGLAIGQLAVVPVVDWLIGGPGPFVLFGL